MSDDKAQHSHLVFACGQSWYAVPSGATAEVVSLPELTRVPGAPAHLLGVFAHRGEVIPVIDLGSLVGATTPELSRRGVLLRLPKGSLAITATKVAGISQLPPADPPPLGQTGVHAHLRGPVKTAAHELALLDPEGLFDHLAGGA